MSADDASAKPRVLLDILTRVDANRGRSYRVVMDDIIRGLERADRAVLGDIAQTLQAASVGFSADGKTETGAAYLMLGHLVNVIANRAPASTETT